MPPTTTRVAGTVLIPAGMCRLSMRLYSTTNKERAAGRYAALTAPLRRQLGGKLLKNPFLYTPWIRKVILSTGIGSMAVRREENSDT